MKIRSLSASIITLSLLTLPAIAEEAAGEIPDISAFLMPEAREIALARSAAPARISGSASILVLREHGYETVIEGSNGFACMVVRSWGGPMYEERGMYDVKAVVPECIDAKAVEVIWPVQVYRTELAIKKTPPKETIAAVIEAFNSGRFHRIEGFALSYMLSNGMMLAADFPGPPHVMFYVPDDYTREMSGDLGWQDQVVYHEGGPDAPYTALMIIRDGIDPVDKE